MGGRDRGRESERKTKKDIHVDTKRKTKREEERHRMNVSEIQTSTHSPITNRIKSLVYNIPKKKSGKNR